MGFNKATKNVIRRGIISDNSTKLLYNAIILKDKEKNWKLGFFTIIRDYLEGEKGLLPLLIVRNKVGTDC